MKKILAIASLLVIASCASGQANYGTEFSMAVADSFQPGITTQSEAIEKLGKPESIKATESGGHRVAWQYRKITTAVSPGSTRSDSVHEGIAIIFDSKGIMERVDRRIQTTGRVR